MSDDIVKLFESPDIGQRVLICRRPDGNYTYRMQWADPSNYESGWSIAGPDCGVYDSIDTAETEAMQRVTWLRSKFN